jgi:uncharacterized protein YukE
MDQDLLAYLEQRFGAMEQRFESMETRFSGEIQGLHQEIRQVHVLVEDIQDKVQLAAEGIMNVNERLDRHQEETRERFDSLESLVRSSDRALASRVETLEHKLKRAS